MKNLTKIVICMASVIVLASCAGMKKGSEPGCHCTDGKKTECPVDKPCDKCGDGHHAKNQKHDSKSDDKKDESAKAK